MGRREMAQEWRPLSMTSGAWHIIYRLSTIIYRVLDSKLLRGGEWKSGPTLA